MILMQLLMLGLVVCIVANTRRIEKLEDYNRNQEAKRVLNGLEKSS